MQIEVTDFLSEVELRELVRICDALVEARSTHKEAIDKANREVIEQSPMLGLIGMIDEGMKQRIMENTLKMKEKHDLAVHENIRSMAVKLRKIAKEVYDLDL